MAKRPLILVTNDDGITAPGIRMLIEIMNGIGDVVVVAPDSPQSGMGHAITINSTLYCTEIKVDDGPQKEYQCSGTPADCVKLAVNELLDRKPDLCVSGINHGSNSSINVIYSGTMSAAIEAGIEGVPAIGFSLLDFRWTADFSPLKPYIEKIVNNALAHKIPSDVVLMSTSLFCLKKKSKASRFVDKPKPIGSRKFDKRQSPMGRDYYWLTGEFINEDRGDDTDEAALRQRLYFYCPHTI